MAAANREAPIAVAKGGGVLKHIFLNALRPDSTRGGGGGGVGVDKEEEEEEDSPVIVAWWGGTPIATCSSTTPASAASTSIYGSDVNRSSSRHRPLCSGETPAALFPFPLPLLPRV